MVFSLVDLEWLLKSWSKHLELYQPKSVRGRKNFLWVIIQSAAEQKCSVGDYTRSCAHVTQTGFDNGAKLLLCMFLWQLKLPFRRWHNVACWFYTMKVTYASRPISVHTQ